jgi:hypothetical protein
MKAAKRALNLLNKQLENRRLKKVGLSLDYPHENNVFIFSDPRGGSTWLTEVILKILKGYEVLWEPLYFNEDEELKKLNFDRRPYIPEDREWPEALDAIDNILKGKALNVWTMSMSNTEDIKKANGLIVKMCRGNASVPWIVRNFKTKLKPIYMIRHPFAVASSQINWPAWDYEKVQFNVPEVPNNEIYSEHAKFLSTIEYIDEELVALWCITNSIALSNPKNNIDWITINYEEMVMNPAETLRRVLNAWDLLDVDIDGIVDFHKPSSTSLDSSAIKGASQVEQWTNRLTTDQIKRMKRVLDYFQIDWYSSDPYPMVVFS